MYHGDISWHVSYTDSSVSHAITDVLAGEKESADRTVDWLTSNTAEHETRWNEAFLLRERNGDLATDD